MDDVIFPTTWERSEYLRTLIATSRSFVPVIVRSVLAMVIFPHDEVVSADQAVEVASHHDHNVVDGTMMSRSLGSSYCCDDDIPLPSKGKLDAATMPNAAWSSIAIVVLAVIGIVLGPVNGESHAISAYKIESSPPHRADIQRHTYLHTSILLI